MTRDELTLAPHDQRIAALQGFVREATDELSRLIHSCGNLRPEAAINPVDYNANPPSTTVDGRLIAVQRLSSPSLKLESIECRVVSPSKIAHVLYTDMRDVSRHLIPLCG
jgi:hypothetical protein